MMPVTLAAMIERGFCDRAHQPDRAAAIDEADVVLGKNLSERDRGLTKWGLVPGPEPQ